jgi:hypothetical protein
MVITVDPFRIVPATEAVISVSPTVEELKLAIRMPPVVFPFIVELIVPLKVPPPEDVRIMEASVRFAPASVMITVMVVVAPAAMALFPGYMVTLAGAPPELPDPVDVPLVTLFCLLTSDTSHPRIIKRAALSNNNKKIEGIGLGNIGFNPNY